MSHGKTPSPESESAPPAKPGEPAAPLNSLWKLMGGPPAELHPEVATKETTITRLREKEASKFDTIVDEAIRAEQQPIPLERESSHSSAQQAPRGSRARSSSNSLLTIDTRSPQQASDNTVLSRKAKTSIWLGSLSVVLCGLSLLPGMWSKFPALSVGFLSLFLGFLAADEIRTSRGRIGGLNQAIVGMCLSITGMFLGPLLSWAIGDLSAFQTHQQKTEGRLQAVGAAVNAFYEHERQFPSGGKFVKRPDGRDLPMHGWMTALLPYLGYEKLHHSIDLSRPFDDDRNTAAMRTQVPEYLVAGDPHTTSVRQFAAAHFAGVGGTQRDADGNEVHLGVFGKNSVVLRHNFTDGLSNTFLAGQLPGSYPAWGDPSNWRQITQGLNRDQRGFGSPSGGPVLFLMADGSVRQLAPDTDLQVLRSLSTRDGGD